MRLINPRDGRHQTTMNPLIWVNNWGFRTVPKVHCYKCPDCGANHRLGPEWRVLAVIMPPDLETSPESLFTMILGQAAGFALN